MNSDLFHKIMIGVFVASLIASGFVIHLANQELFATSDEIANIKAEREVLDTKISNYLRDKNFIEANEDLFEAVEQALPKDKDQADLVAELKQFASDYQLEIETIAFDSTAGASDPTTSQTVPVKNIPGVRVISSNVRFKGTDTTTYENLMKFINRVENNRRIMQITEISLLPSRDSNDNPILGTAVLTIEAFIRS